MRFSDWWNRHIYRWAADVAAVLSRAAVGDIQDDVGKEQQRLKQDQRRMVISIK